MNDVLTSDPPPAVPKASIWTRRVVAPIARQLRLGITPKEIALTIALGLTLGIFPILGATTILCTIAAARLRLNQPIIQLVNYVAYPLQLVSLLPFYRAGETLFGRPHLPLSIPMLIERFGAGPMQFLADYGMIGMYGIAVWCIVAPSVAGAAYVLVQPPLRVLARRLTGVSRTAA